MELFRELLDGSNNHLGIRLSEELQIQCDLSLATQLLVFIATVVARLLVFKVIMKLRREWEQVTVPKKFAILIKLLQHFLSKHTSNHCKPSTDFQISEKVDVDNFCCHFHCFYVGADLWRSSVYHFGSFAKVNICLIWAMNIKIFFYRFLLTMTP